MKIYNPISKTIEKEFTAAICKPYSCEKNKALFIIYGKELSATLTTNLQLEVLQLLSVIHQTSIPKDVSIEIHDSQNVFCGTYIVHFLFNCGAFDYSFTLDEQLISYLKSIREARYGK